MFWWGLKITKKVSKFFFLNVFYIPPSRPPFFYVNSNHLYWHSNYEHYFFVWLQASHWISLSYICKISLAFGY